MGDFDYRILSQVAHRPWPMPRRPWLMTQTWHDLLFAHWAVKEGDLRAHIPAEFELDTFGKFAWVGIVPFRMSNVVPRGVPVLPWLSSFPELNVRTYVRVRGEPGVYFFSLDAARGWAVVGGRMLNLPYHLAAMSMRGDATNIGYDSQRRSDSSVRLRAHYGRIGAESPPAPGTLEYFLTERYCLYQLDRGGRPFRIDIHHPPWQLCEARATFEVNTMASAQGLAIPPQPALLHFAARQDVVVWGRRGCVL